MPVIPSVQDKAAVTNDEIFQECRERLQLAVEAEGANRGKATMALEFGDGQQWPQDLYNQRRNRVTLTINHTNTLVRRVVNNMRQQRPRIKVHPVGDGAQISDAKVAGGVIRHIENLSKASVAYDTAGESAVRIGWGYFRILADYIDEMSFDQELKIVAVRNTLTGYIDPAAVMPDGSDMDWFIFTETMKRAEFKRLYPDEDLNQWADGGSGDTDIVWQDKETVRLAEYYRIKYVKDTLYKLSDGRTLLKSDFDKEAFGLAGITVVDKRATERRQVQWFRLSGTTVVDSRDLPGHWIPVIRCEGNVLDINGDVRRKGMIIDMMDPARQYNYWQSAKTEKLALSSKSPWIAAVEQLEGHEEWDDANQHPYSVLKYNLVKDENGQIVPIPPPIRAPAIEVDAGFVEAGQSAEHDLLAVAGMAHEPGMDQQGQQAVSGVAIRQRQMLADIAHYQYYDNQTQAIAHCGTILLDLIPHYYSKPKMQRIIGEDGMPEMVAINQASEDGSTKNDLSFGRYSVVMDTGPGYETKRQEGAEAMLSLMGVKPLAEQIVKTRPDLIVRGIDAPYMDELADALATTTPEGMKKVVAGLPKDAQNVVGALQGQLQQATQKIQQLEMEVKFKQQIEQGWMHTEIEKAQIQAKSRMDDTHLKNIGKMHDTEIKVAGDMLNTHVEAEHNKEAAKLELQAAAKAERSSAE